MVSKSSVANILRRSRLSPAPRRSGPSWADFLRFPARSAKVIVESDFLSVDTVLLRGYYVLFIIEIERRVVHLLGVTAHPNGPWATQVARNFCSDLGDAGRRVQFLVRNRDTKFSKSFAEVFASMGVATILTPVRAPKANAFAERWVRTVREDCLDRILVFSRRQLERVLAEYVEHYNRGRPHRSLELTPPRDLSPSDHVGSVRRRDVLGGIIHEYERAA